MLDTETKSRIDAARDILVGKIPNPQAQVEQITIALIYKFMDDMDTEAEELGGKRKFFSGSYREYSWRNLMTPKLGGHEVFKLYVDAIQKMNLNPNIPQLFRDIFKNAYLPYNDPETLRSFLKTINEFNYDHSERLGDAFEYLLSILGSQGDAGQFRTPRHIIDFMVYITDPKKNETILDPACGTAGFLISSYKHIVKNNSSDYLKKKDYSFTFGNGDRFTGDKLTPDDRKKLAANIKGFDISPDMVRLSLVNLYLHGFAEPKIFEYDTLTSEDRWNEYANVILANPPFMSPKGGIRPHKKFSIESSRSEVLFVDYIAEHLTPLGRAAVIVPEGIIFQSGTAYKSLRKMLVENHLYAVVSLPAGVFNPYSGVKTSILLMDKTLSKRTENILFAKVENDGFDLGAQRRANTKGELPETAKAIKEYKESLATGKNFPIENYPNLLLAPKSKISESGDFNLSGERYREITKHLHEFPSVRIKEVCYLNPKKSLLTDKSPDLEVSFVPMADINENNISFKPRDKKILKEVSNSYTYFEDGDVLLARVTPCFENGKAGIARNLINGIGFGSSEFYVFRPNEKILSEWLYFCVMHPRFKNNAILNMTGTGGLQRIPRSYIENFQIPLPPLEVQKEIVAEIEGYQKIIDGARQIVDNYKPRINIDPNWPVKYLINIAENLDSKRIPITKSDRKSGKFPYYGASGIVDYVEEYIFDEDILLVSEDGANLLARSTPIAFSVSGKSWVNNHSHVLKFSNIETQKLVEIFINSISIKEFITGSAQPKLNQQALNKIPIPLPPLEVQKEIVARIEREQELVNANKELIKIFESKIKSKISSVWGEEESL